MLSVVLFTMLAVPLVCGLPRPNESNTPLDVSKPKESNGKCRMLNGIEINAGEWKAVENCTLNCTCRKADFEILECNDWCKTERKVCREDEILSQTKYFEQVGNTGCKRCKIEVCDALLPRKYNQSSMEFNMTKSVNKTHGIEGIFEVIEETIVIFKKPKKKLNNSD